jgi:hypothetical protein
MIMGVAIAAATGGAATAQPADSGEPEPTGGDEAGPTINRINLRVGGATTDANGKPTICLEVRTWSRLSVEACGTGAGVLHDADGSEMAHFRLMWQAWGRPVGGGWLAGRGGGGFAELQLGDDAPGFQFGDPDADRLSVAGPEATGSIAWMRPIGRGVELIVDGTLGAAWLPGAGALVVPHDRLAPFASFELGVGW